MKIADELKMLRELVTEADRLDENDIEEEARSGFQKQTADAMRDMLKKMELGDRICLTDKQVTYVKDVYARVFSVEFAPVLMSSGLIPRGKEVVTPDVLKNLPKLPPGRIAR